MRTIGKDEDYLESRITGNRYVRFVGKGKETDIREDAPRLPFTRPTHHRIKVSRPRATLWAMFLHATHEVTHESEEYHVEHFTSQQSHLYLGALERFLQGERSLVRELIGRKPSGRKRREASSLSPGQQVLLPGLQ